MKLEKRIEALESKLLSAPVKLHFADGSTRFLYGPRDFMLDLIARASSDLTPTQVEQLDLIRRCTSAEEPGGARLVELIQSMDGPTEEWEDEIRE